MNKPSREARQSMVNKQPNDGSNNRSLGENGTSSSHTTEIVSDQFDHAILESKKEYLQQSVRSIDPILTENIAFSETQIEKIPNQLDVPIAIAGIVNSAKNLGIYTYLLEEGHHGKLLYKDLKKRKLLIDLANTIDDSLLDRAIDAINDLEDEFTKATNLLPSAYVDGLEDETAYEFIMRTNPEYPRYKGERNSGDIIAWLRTNYRDRNYLDGRLFTKATLRKLDPSASERLKVWCRGGKPLPDDLNIPLKKGQSRLIAAGLTAEQMKAAASLVSAGYLKTNNIK